MSMNDILADTFARIRNAQQARKAFTLVSSTKQVISVLTVLKNEGYINFFEEFEQRPGINLVKVDLKYHDGEPVIRKLSRVSRCGNRVYGKIKNLPKVMGGLGILILSTPKGVMSDLEAQSFNVGGEILGECY